jgi:hypothetical protein
VSVCRENAHYAHVQKKKIDQTGRGDCFRTTARRRREQQVDESGYDSDDRKEEIEPGAS